MRQACTAEAAWVHHRERDSVATTRIAVTTDDIDHTAACIPPNRRSLIARPNRNGWRAARPTESLDGAGALTDTHVPVRATDEYGAQPTTIAHIRRTS